MSSIEKTYQHAEIEPKLYEAWLEAACFEGKIDDKREGYSIVIPPPNVTGILTLGHVLNNTLQDILIRHARQQGKSVFWLPGTDHAGLATEIKVEKSLREAGTSREELGREAFLEKAKEWRDDHGGIILKQLKRLGVSCDWDKIVHTLDEDYSKAVIKAFVVLYKQGAIYRGKRMINWCPVSQTALSDEEVSMKPLKRSIYTVRYELVDQPGEFLEVATTRPETIMVDTAVAVHPKDERYKHLIGKQVWRPLQRKEIPIIAEESIEMEFGTGVLKVTPAHDKTDFEIGLRNGLDAPSCIDAKGYLNENAGPDFQGMERFKAQKAIAKKLDDLGLLVKEEPYESSVGFSERGNVPIEPMISEQWFLKYPQVEAAKRVVREGIIQFHPERWSKVYLNWLDQIQDWCISRQIWWGHRIPVWYRKGADRSIEANRYVGETAPPDPENWEQEEDTLDTWASAWLWPFATMGWPDFDTKDRAAFQYWYPTSDLVTGPDILFFWVARMIMASLAFRPNLEGADPAGEASSKAAFSEVDLSTADAETLAQCIPFKNVYFTGIIRDSMGRKMSKSLGNSPDPIDLMDTYGADGLRFGIISCAPQGQDIPYFEERIAHGRNFCTKLWNACRFRQLSGPMPSKSTLASSLTRIQADKLSLADKGILSSLLSTLEKRQQSFDAYHFHSCLKHLYSFFWNDFCDFYLEACKLRPDSDKDHILAVQDLCLRQVLLMLHPFTPFITDSLWQQLGFGKGFIQNVAIESADALRTSLKAQRILDDPESAIQVETLRRFISSARTLKAQYRLGHKKDLCFYYLKKANQDTEQMSRLIEPNLELIKGLIGASSFEATAEAPSGMPATVTELTTLYLDLRGHIDVGAQRTQLLKEKEQLQSRIDGSRKRLQDPKFTEKAPEKVIDGVRTQLKQNEQTLDEIESLLQTLSH